MFGLGNVVQYRGLWVDKKLDISEVYPQAMHPVALEREFESTFTDGKLMVKITTQRQACCDIGHVGDVGDIADMPIGRNAIFVGDITKMSR